MVVGVSAHKGGQYCYYGLMLSRSLVIIQGARPEIGDAPLGLISRIGQGARRLLFHIESRPVTRLWIDVTIQLFDSRKDQTKIVDAHFRDIPIVIRCAITLHDSHTVIIDSE